MDNHPLTTITGTLVLHEGCLYVPISSTEIVAIALSLETGQILWSKQTQSRDAWNAACIQAGANCPDNHGPDYDFGAPPIAFFVK